jgi:hypothetical protein
MHYRAQLVDYLPYVSLMDFTILTRRPRETPSLETLFVPFDTTIWAFVGIAMLCEFLLFVTMDGVSSHLNLSTWNWHSVYKGKSN